MQKFGKSQSVTRCEDQRFLTGHGKYIDDACPESALFGVVFRSVYAHAIIKSMDISTAESAPGVVEVVTAASLDAAGITQPMQAARLNNRDGQGAPDTQRLVLAKDRLRFVGEPVAMVFAKTLAQARAATEQILIEVDMLPLHLDLMPGGEPLHDEAPDNLAFDWAMGQEDAVQRAVLDAAHVVRVEVVNNRIICNSMEPRGCWADMENGRLHVCINGQGVWAPKSQLAAMLNLDADNIRVTNPDVGGAFGMKAMMYPEYFVVAHVAKKLGQPVRWMSDRNEAMVSDNAGRDLVSNATLAFDENYKIQAYGVQTRANMGAYCSQLAQPIQTNLFSKVLTGVYDVPHAHLSVQGIYTNTTQVDAYRGAGRPEAIYLLERAMDYAARELGLDPWELRRRNFIPVEKFAHKTPTGVTYDVGDFDQVLSKSKQLTDLEGFTGRKAKSAAAGKIRGLGLCCYIESILGSPSEDSRVVFNPDGTLDLFVGTQSAGQGHETVYAQYLSDQTGVPTSAINVIQGDSDKIPVGGGTGGSRSATVQNTATLGLAHDLIEKYSAFLSAQHDDADIEFDDDVFRAAGTNQSWSLLDAAELARLCGRPDLLDMRKSITLDGHSFPNGAHVAEVEIDPETGESQVVCYVIVDDFGHLLNPMLVEGQVHGGVAQGLGQAMMERVVYDDQGQLLTASFMDYTMPRAADLPDIDFNSLVVPSTANPIGMKGCGEAGTIGAMAAVANAMMDALASQGVKRADMPFTAHRVWAMLQAVA